MKGSRRSLMRVALIVGACLGMVAGAGFSTMPAFADDAKGDIYVGYVEPGVWQVRDSEGEPVKTVTVTEAGPVWFSENQELPVGTYTIHLLRTPDGYVSIDDSPAATVEVIDTGGRIPSGIGQMSAPYWKQIMSEYKGIPSLKFQDLLSRYPQECEGDTSASCAFGVSLREKWNEKKAGISVDDLVVMPEFADYVTEITSNSWWQGSADSEVIARSILLTGNAYDMWGGLGGNDYVAFGLPARVTYDERDYGPAWENYARYRIEYVGNTVDEEVLAWAVGAYVTGTSDDDPEKEETFMRLMGNLTFEDYMAIAEHFMQETNYYSAVVTLEALNGEDWYWDNWEEYDLEIEPLYNTLISMTSSTLYFTDKSGDGMFSMADITTEAEKENLFGSLYVSKGEIIANKKLEGRTLNSGEFSFGLYRQSDINEASGSTSGLAPLAVATNEVPSASDGTGNIRFYVSRPKEGAWVPVEGFPGLLEMPYGYVVEFTGREAGETVWSGEVFSDLAVAENAGVDSLIVYDDTIVPVNDFDVTPYGSTPISTAHLEKTNGDATFVNTVLQRRDEETTLVNVRKELRGRDLESGEFTFQLCADAACNTVLEEVSNNADGSVPFTKVTINPLEWSQGTHILYVREVIPTNSLDNVRYDVENSRGAGKAMDFSFQITHRVVMDGIPVLLAEVTPSEPQEIVFVNEYFNPPATMVSSGTLPARLLVVVGFGFSGAFVGFAYVRHRLSR